MSRLPLLLSILLLLLLASLAEATASDDGSSAEDTPTSDPHAEVVQLAQEMGLQPEQVIDPDDLERMREQVDQQGDSKQSQHSVADVTLPEAYVAAFEITHRNKPGKDLGREYFDAANGVHMVSVLAASHAHGTSASTQNTWVHHFVQLGKKRVRQTAETFCAETALQLAPLAANVTSEHPIDVRSDSMRLQYTHLQRHSLRPSDAVVREKLDAHSRCSNAPSSLHLDALHEYLALRAHVAP